MEKKETKRDIDKLRAKGSLQKAVLVITNLFHSLCVSPTSLPGSVSVFLVGMCCISRGHVFAFQVTFASASEEKGDHPALPSLSFSHSSFPRSTITPLAHDRSSTISLNSPACTTNTAIYAVLVLILFSSLLKGLPDERGVLLCESSTPFSLLLPPRPPELVFIWR